MSTELAIATERGQSLADLMGVNPNAGASYGPDIARITMIHNPIMGTVEMGGKSLKTEVLPVGTYHIVSGDNDYYATEVKVRIFAQRQQWTRWNSETDTMEKTVLANSLNGDLMDNLGGFNLGRPSGYVEDFNALPEKTKTLMRSVRRTKVVFGTVSSDTVFDVEGNPIDAIVDMPFVMDIKSTLSIKNLDTALNKFKGLPILTEVNLTAEEGTLPSGGTFGKIVAKLGAKRELEEGDEDLLRNFIELIEYMNGKVMDKYHENNNASLSPEDAAMVTDILDNEFVDAD